MPSLFRPCLLCCILLSFFTRPWPSTAQAAPPPKTAPAAWMRPEVDVIWQRGVEEKDAGHAQESLRLFNEALGLARRLGDEPGIAQNQFDIGEALLNVGPYEKAIPAFEEAAAIYQRLGPISSQMGAFDRIGQVYDAMNRPLDALQTYNCTLAGWHELGSTRNEAVTLRKIGIIQYYLKQYTVAHVSFLSARQKWLGVPDKTAQDRKAEVNTIYWIGECNAQLHRLPAVLRSFQESRRLYHLLGDKDMEAFLWSRLGDELPNEQGQLEAKENAFALYNSIDKKTEALAILNRLVIGYSSTEQHEKILATYKLAQPLWVAVSETDRKDSQETFAIFLNSIATPPYFIREKQSLNQATQAATLSVGLWRQLGRTTEQRVALCNLGTALTALQETEQAKRIFAEAQALCRQPGDVKAEIDVLGDAYRAFDRYAPDKRPALKYLDAQIALQLQIGDKEAAADGLDSLGHDYESTEQWRGAIQVYEKSLHLWQELAESGDKNAKKRDTRKDQARLYSLLGRAYENSKQSAEALAAYQTAGNLRHELNDVVDEAYALHSQGDIFSDLGRYLKAVALYKKALDLVGKTEDITEKHSLLKDIGRAYRDVGNLPLAMDAFKKAAAIAISQDKTGDTASVLLNIAAIQSTNQYPQQAIETLNRSIALLEKGRKALASADDADEDDERYLLFTEWMAFLKRGSIYEQMNQTTKAMTSYQQAGALFNDKTDIDQLMRSITTCPVAHLQSRSGQVKQAEANYLQALRLMVRFENNPTVKERDIEDSFLKLKLMVYKDYANFLSWQERDGEAFNWIEKAKAEELRRLMRDGQPLINPSFNADEQETLQELQAAFNERNKRLMSEVMRRSPDVNLIQNCQAQLAQVQSESTRFRAAMNVKYPNVGRSETFQPVNLSSVARWLPPKTALLEYHVLDEWIGDDQRVVLFVVTVEKGRPVVKHYPIDLTGEQIGERIADLRAACSGREGRYENKARELYNVLVAPASARLGGKEHLIVCPDGPLWELPFEVLRFQPKPGATMPYQFLMERFQITRSYSATALSAALDEKKNPRRPRPTSKILVCANPDYGPEDRFTRESKDDKDRGLRAPSRRALLPEGWNLKRLPGTQDEATALSKLFPGPATSVFTDKNAQKDAVLKSMGKFQYLHFATHGYFNETAPLFSFLMLAEPTDKNGDEGLLTALDILDQNLAAEMVVLSACDTGRGQSGTGLGLVGFSWALFAAGVPTQVVSQWQVDDESTSELMQKFYANLKTQSKSAALRRAALDTMRDYPQLNFGQECPAP